MINTDARYVLVSNRQQQQQQQQQQQRKLNHEELQFVPRVDVHIGKQHNYILRSMVRNDLNNNAEFFMTSNHYDNNHMTTSHHLGHGTSISSTAQKRAMCDDDVDLEADDDDASTYFPLYSPLSAANHDRRSPAKKPKFVVTYREMKEFFNLLNEKNIQQFLKRDSCCLISDKYALAMVFTYFKRAKFFLNEYTRINFYLALYLANDVEEDIDDYKYEIFPWALGRRWRNSFSGFLRKRDALLRRIGYRAIVSRKCCEEVMSLAPDYSAWKRERSEGHGGATRAYLINNSKQYLCNKMNLFHEETFTLPRGPDAQPRPCLLCIIDRDANLSKRSARITSPTISNFNPVLSAGIISDSEHEGHSDDVGGSDLGAPDLFPIQQQQQQQPGILVGRNQFGYADYQYTDDAYLDDENEDGETTNTDCSSLMLTTTTTETATTASMRSSTTTASKVTTTHTSNSFSSSYLSVLNDEYNNDENDIDDSESDQFESNSKRKLTGLNDSIELVKHKQMESAITNTSTSDNLTATTSDYDDLYSDNDSVESARSNINKKSVQPCEYRALTSNLISTNSVITVKSASANQLLDKVLTSQPSKMASSNSANAHNESSERKMPSANKFRHVKLSDYGDDYANKENDAGFYHSNFSTYHQQQQTMHQQPIVQDNKNVTRKIFATKFPSAASIGTLYVKDDDEDDNHHYHHHHYLHHRYQHEHDQHRHMQLQQYDQSIHRHHNHNTMQQQQQQQQHHHHHHHSDDEDDEDDDNVFMVTSRRPQPRETTHEMQESNAHMREQIKGKCLNERQTSSTGVGKRRLNHSSLNTHFSCSGLNTVSSSSSNRLPSNEKKVVTSVKATLEVDLISKKKHEQQNELFITDQQVPKQIIF